MRIKVDTRWRLTAVTSLAVRGLALLLGAQSLVGCSRFVWREEPFTPDPAPATEVLASGGDTTYVLESASYYLLARNRAALWNREVLDDVAWRYRALFGDAPPLIAVRLDSARGSADSATWRGVPLAVAAGDSARTRLIARPMLAATAAEAWMKARAWEAVGSGAGQPGGSSRAPSAASALPAWLEAATLRTLAAPAAADRALAELRGAKHVVPLDSLFGVTWRARPNAAEMLRTGAARLDAEEENLRPRRREEIRGPAGVSPLFISQSVSVLHFLRERDPELVGRLVDEAARGRPMSAVLAASGRLPHDVAALDAEWRRWLQRSARRR
jgi:hypothetical protein